MKLSDQDIREFKALYEEEFAEILSHREAREIAEQAIALYVVLSTPLKPKK